MAVVVYHPDSDRGPTDEDHPMINRMAKLAGMRAVLINRDQRTPGRTPPPEAAKLLAPDFIVTQLTQLPALLDSLG